MSAEQVAVLRFGNFELQPTQRSLLVAGQPAALGARAFDVLLALCERRERVVTKVELFDLVWPGLVVEENNVQQQISSLRKLLGRGVIATVPGRGYRFIAALAADANKHGEPQLQPRAQERGSRHNLPSARTRFIGREAALAECTNLLRGTRILTLTGIGGCGKTRLAQQLARQELNAFNDGVWFVDLAPLHDPQRVAVAVAAVLEVREEAGAALIPRLVAHAAARRMLLVLDNCEHVIDAVTALIEALLAGCAQVSIVATSREVLGITGEQVYPVRSLALPESADIDAVRNAEAISVFTDRARLVSPGFTVETSNAATITEICRRLDGLPLGIELAAARIKMLSGDEILGRLNDRFRLLTGGSRAAPRQQTLQATMQWSYELLTTAEQQLFFRLAVFAGGWSLRAAAQVAASEDDYALLELLTKLHDKSLLLVDRSADAKPRYRMLETVRQYAQDRLLESGEGDATRTRHLLHYVALAEEAAAHLAGPRQGEWMARLRIEQENLLVAHAWCQQANGGAALGLRVTGALWRYWSSSAQLERGYQLASDALAYPRGDDDELARGRVLLGLGQIAFRMGRYQETLRCAEQALTLGRHSNDPVQIASALGLLGNGYSATEQMASALGHYEQARDMARALDDRFQLANVLNNLAEVHRALGRLDAAEQSYEEALRIARDLGNAGITAIVSCNLARLSVAAGKFQHARQQLIECQTIADAAGLKGLGEDWLEVGASLAVALGDYTMGARLHGASLARMSEAGARREPVDDAVIAPLMSRAKSELGAAMFDATEADGHALSYEASMVLLSAWLTGTAIAPQG